MKWQAVIGLEIHVQLNTSSKIFSNASTAQADTPNAQASIIDLALPGTLPVLNVEVVEKACIFGLAIGAHINQHSTFERKNYFYPDLSKGYQISQLVSPIVKGGVIEIESRMGKKVIDITRAHLEEDAGKSIHDLHLNETAIDFNRAGMPLLEIVSEPQMNSAEEAQAYAKVVHELVQCLNICDGNLEKGSFRCDANVSIRTSERSPLGVRTELKNINSFKFLHRAIELEIQRQISLLEDGGRVTQETRLYDQVSDTTRSIRSKEEAADYRYFPDPDLLTVEVTDEWLSLIKAKLPELPSARKKRWINELGLSEYDAEILGGKVDITNYFEALYTLSKDAKGSANWVMGEFSAALNKTSLSALEARVSPNSLAELMALVAEETLSLATAKTVFRKMWVQNLSAREIVEVENLAQQSDEGELKQIVEAVVAENSKQVQQFLDGNSKIVGFLVGAALKKSAGKANPKRLHQMMDEYLKKL